MKVCIVDDEIAFSKKVKERVYEYFTERNEAVSIAQYYDGCCLLDALEEEQKFDIYFLDIEIPDINGMELAQKIRKMDESVYIVLLTSYTKYAIPGYKIKAYYYILKNEYLTEIPFVLDRVRDEIREHEKREKYYLIRNEISGNRINLNDILYIKKEKKYVRFHLKDGKEYRERTSLGKVYGELSREQFIHVDKGCIINMSCVVGWTGATIKLEKGTDVIEIPMSRRMSSDVKNQLTLFWRKK